MKMISNKEVSRVVILCEDRLIRFGYEMFAYFCELNDTEIEIIDHTETTGEQELTEDLIQIITVFANRLYGKRSKKTKKLILIQIITVFANRLYGKRSKKTKKLIAEVSKKEAESDEDGKEDPASADA